MKNVIFTVFLPSYQKTRIFKMKKCIYISFLCKKEMDRCEASYPFLTIAFLLFILNLKYMHSQLKMSLP